MLMHVYIIVGKGLTELETCIDVQNRFNHA